MIYTKNQWICKFDIANYNDFILQDDFISLLYVEDASMSLPAIELKFIIRDQNVLNSLNQGSVLTVGLGRDEVSMLDLKFRIITDLSIKRPTLGQLISIGGILDNYEFTSNNDKNETYVDKTSLEVVQEEAKKYFVKVKTNMDKTNDRQTWQKHQTPWSFLQNVCNQGFINDKTYLLSAFDNDTFYYYDYRKMMLDAVNNIATIPIFSKTRASGEKGNIITYRDTTITGGSGVTSEVLGNNQITVEYNWEDYSIRLYQNNLLGFTSIGTNNLPMSETGALDTVYKSLYSSESKYSNLALTQNSKNAILSSNVQIFVSIGGQFKDLKLLDVVLFDDSADARIVGLAIVSKIAYQIIDNNFYTNITLVRESFNEIKGDGLQTSIVQNGES